jgi:membrane associated rhomboid family serine protease
MSYRDNFRTDKTSIWKNNNALLLLIVFNVFIFITLRFSMAVYGLSNLSESLFYKHLFQWFAMPANAGMFITRPWTIITAMFAHLDVFLLISNLFWLWSYGFIFQDLTGNNRTIPLYLYGGVAGAVAILLSYNLIPSLKSTAINHFYFGATTPIIAIVAGTTFLSPKYRLFPMINGGIPLWIVTSVFSLIDLFFLTSHIDMILPHVLSAIVGLIFIQALKNGHDLGEWMNNSFHWITNIFTPKVPVTKKQMMRQEVFYNTRGQKPFKKTANLTQQRVDEILDKINLKGYNKLTDDEKEILRRASEEEL